MGVKKYLFAIFAVTAVTILMAFIGVGSASATVLCSESTTSECTSDGGPVINASLTKASKISTTEGTVLDECTSGTIVGAPSKIGSSTETVSGPVGELTWASCTKTTDTISNGELEIHSISGTDNGTVTGKNSSVTAFISGVSCTYGTGTGTDLGTLEGGSPATINVSAVLAKTAGGFLCPASVKWTATYSVTSPQPLDVAESAAAAAPAITVLNSGGVEKANTNRCEFEIFNQTCSITVTNNSVFAVVIKEVELVGTNVGARYGFSQVQCNKSGKIAAGGFCTDIVKIFANPPAPGWSNWYFIKVEKEGEPKDTATANVWLKTK
jgi:hypothetical protein